MRCLEYGAMETGYNYLVDFWALGIMLAQLLCGEQLDFYIPMSSGSDEETIQSMNIAENLELPRHISPEARSCVKGLLEVEPENRLGSPNSSHGSIRDHPFFKVGRAIDWQEIDQGLFKPMPKNIPVKSNEFYCEITSINLIF